MPLSLTTYTVRAGDAGKSISALVRYRKPSGEVGSCTTAGISIPPPLPADGSLLLRMEGENNSTSIIDSGPDERTVSIIGSGRISTAQSKAGLSSYYSQTINDRLLVSGLFNYGPGDFTWETWWYPTEFTNGYKALFSVAGSVTSWHLFTNDDLIGRRMLFVRENGVGDFYVLDGLSGVTIPLNQWNHAAVTREDGILRTRFNGVVLQSGPFPDSVSGICSVGTHATDGFAFGPGYNPLGTRIGFLDLVRMSPFCRYPGADPFIPPVDY
jgi:hypothetical protein